MSDKQTEALKLAQDLRALADRFSEGWHEGIKIDALDIELLANAAEALAEQPAQRIKQGWDVDTLLNKPKQPAQQQEPDCVQAERDRLARECARLPFGDTAASFAVWIAQGGGQTL